MQPAALHNDVKEAYTKFGGDMSKVGLQLVRI
jgi:hypothetical protein